MKTYKYLLAFAATVALASCTQDFLDEQGRNPQAEGPRTIAVSFGPQTRTALGQDGVTPKFENGDEILVATTPKEMTEEPKTEPCTISVDSKGNASFTTTLTGALTAYYPASAAGEGEKIGFAIPAMQSGKFADANYAWATIPADATAATFENVFPLFVITPPEGAKSLTIKSLPTIGGEGQRSGEPQEICNDLDNPYTITVKGTDTDGIYYVVLSDPVNLSDLSFDLQSETAGQGWMLGITEAQAGDNNAVLPNKAYKVGGAANWHEYVTVGDYKWATMNLGATAPTEPGDYFMWGAVEKAYTSLSNNTFTFGTKPSSYDNSTWDAEKGFSWENAPFTKGVFNDTDSKNVFTKYHGGLDLYSASTPPDNKSVLDLSDDAAYVNWGGAWRMPTITELSVSVLGNGEWNDENKGSYFGKLFLPAAGFSAYNSGSDGTILVSAGMLGLYWSSSLVHGRADIVQTRTFIYMGNMYTPDFSSMNTALRCYGAPIRAIIDDTNL